MLICDRSRAKHYLDEATGRDYFAVSQVLSVLDPDRFAMVRRDVLDRAMLRGTQVHQIFARILAHRARLKGYEDFDLATIPPVLRGYASGLFDWADRNRVYPRKIESPSICWLHGGFAGTPDGLVAYGREQILTIVELKSGIEERLNRIQVQAYSWMDGYRDAKMLLLVYVDKTGKVREKEVKPNPHDKAWFLSGLGVLHGRLAA
jgi:hypothetical protein